MLRAVLHSVKPMVVGGGASTWVALKVLRARQNFALLMVVGGGVSIQKDAPRQLEASQDFALDTVEGSGVRWKVAPVVLKGRLACAFLMGVVAVASTTDVRRVPRGVPCSARHMVVGSDAYLQGATKVQKGARHYVKDMVGESAASLMVVVSVQRVYMVAQIFVLPMVVERDALCQAAQRVHVGALIVVLGMVVANVVSLRIVGKVPKVTQTSAKLMVVESDALGWRENVRNLLGGRAVYVRHTAAWSKIGRQTREVLSGLDSFMGLYLLLQQQQVAVLTTIIHHQELVLYLIASSHWKSQQKGHNSYLHRYWYLYL